MYLASYKHKRFVLKCCESLQSSRKEAEILSRVRGEPHIVPLLGVYQKGEPGNGHLNFASKVRVHPPPTSEEVLVFPYIRTKPLPTAKEEPEMRNFMSQLLQASTYQIFFFTFSLWVIFFFDFIL